MPNVIQYEAPKDDVSPQQHKDLNNHIREQAIQAMGRPDNLFTVQVREVWADHYRVNVLVGSITTIRVANSYFVVTDSSGGLITATPQIAKLY